MRINNFLPPLLKDFYKVGHVHQYPKGTQTIDSNWTARGTRRLGWDRGVIWAGLQYFIDEYLLNRWERNFFLRPRDQVVKEYKRIVDACLGPGTNVNHIGELHELDYLPLQIKALPEGTLVPYRVPCMTVRNTDDKFFWLTNALETILSASLYRCSTSATTAFQYRQAFEKYGKLTGVPKDLIKWQGHDFSMRGMELEAACLSGFGHLLSFYGTDTIPAVMFAEEYYHANVERELVGGSVPATEHSVMCVGGQTGEFKTIERLITEVYPRDIVSIVVDTWNIWEVIWDYLPRLKDAILAREGKVVLRPDSGDPVKILLGDPESEDYRVRAGVYKGLLEVIGGTRDANDFLHLDPHIGAIYGDSITLDRQDAILRGLYNMRISFEGVLGIGSFTYAHVTRDTDGWAMKATYAKVNGKDIAIQKDPVTDSGLKKSATGLLKVEEVEGKLTLVENVDWKGESEGLLKEVFNEGFAPLSENLTTMRGRVESYLEV
jgi:nicotinamide phosphoribosyltransferase